MQLYIIYIYNIIQYGLRENHYQKNRAGSAGAECFGTLGAGAAWEKKQELKPEPLQKKIGSRN